MFKGFESAVEDLRSYDWHMGIIKAASARFWRDTLWRKVFKEVRGIFWTCINTTLQRLVPEARAENHTMVSRYETRLVSSRV